MKNLISYFFTIIPLIVFSQSEKITNGNFESGLRLWTNTCLTSSDDYMPSNSQSLNGCEAWYMAFSNPANCGNSCETSDWIDKTLPLCNTSVIGNIIPPANSSSNRFAGLVTNGSGYTEGIRTTLTTSLQAGKYYKLSLKMAVGKSNFHNPNTPLIGGSVNISFSKWGEHWASNPLTTGNVRWDNVAKFTIPDNSPHEWYTFTKYFKVPNSVSGGSSNDLSNLLIIRKNETVSYLIIDDVSLVEYNPCTSICLDPKFKDPISYNCCGGSPNHVPNAMTTNIPFNFKIDNITEIKFTVWDSWGGLVKEIVNYDPNGLKWENDPQDEYGGSYPFFRFIWNGRDYANDNLPSNTVVVYILEMKNCNHSITLSGNITSLNPPNTTVTNPDFSNTAIDFQCCQHTKYVDGVYQNTPTAFEAEKYIKVATQNPVTISWMTAVSINAGTEIEIGPNFQVDYGCEVDIHLESCNKNGFFKTESTGTSVNIPSDVNNSFLFGDQTTALSHHSNDLLNQTSFTIIPNPATKESIFCRFEYLTSGVPTYFNYEIINSTGIVVSQGSGIEYQNPIGGIYITNINSLSMGLYTIRVFDEENNFHSKLIISHD